MLILGVELDMRLIHLDPKFWLAENFEALELLNALVSMIVKQDLISLAVII